VNKYENQAGSSRPRLPGIARGADTAGAPGRHAANCTGGTETEWKLRLPENFEGPFFDIGSYVVFHKSASHCAGRVTGWQLVESHAGAENRLRTYQRIAVEYNPRDTEHKFKGGEHVGTFYCSYREGPASHFDAEGEHGNA
jgi:hypothetical protein